MKIKIFLLLAICTPFMVYCQSSIVYGSGTAITIGNGADVCAQTITVNGTVSGGGNFCNGSLPVELVSFSARVVKDNIELSWQTATEVNNNGFEIEKASTTDESGIRNWQKLGFVEGSGTSHTPKAYSFIDKNLLAGKYFYRLKQIDRDGKFTYSHSVEVTAGQVSKVFTLDQNYPNPFNPATLIRYQLSSNNHTTINVYDAIGREVATLVNERKEAGSYSITFNAYNLPSGIYFYSIRSGDYKMTKTMSLLK